MGDAGAMMSPPRSPPMTVKPAQYAAAFQFHHRRLGVPDHPLSRMMTTEFVALSPPLLFVMAGQQRVFRARCPGHRRLSCRRRHETWMPVRSNLITAP
jgi:hypothetical protein